MYVFWRGQCLARRACLISSSFFTVCVARAVGQVIAFVFMSAAAAIGVIVSFTIFAPLQDVQGLVKGIRIPGQRWPAPRKFNMRGLRLLKNMAL